MSLPPTVVGQLERQRVVPPVLDRLKRVGINLKAYQWNYEHAFPDAVGFYFTCSAYQQLLNAAEASRSTEINFEDLPTNDKWAQQAVTHIGFIERNVVEPVAIDFSLSNLGDCRAGIVPHFSKQRGEAFRQQALKAAHGNDVYNEIARRLRACNPPVVLDDHIGRIQRFGKTTLDGVNFFARDYRKLKQILVDARNDSGLPFFGHAILDNLDHWALRASFLATDGTGFREASGMKLRNQPLFGGQDRRDSMGWRRNAARFTGAFNDPQTLPDMSSLHCAVSNQGCNIHVDEVGFVLQDELGNLVLDADAIQHIVNELLWKTYGKYILPEGLVNRVNLVLPTTSTQFNRVGVEVDAYRTKNLRLTVSATCSVFGERECSGTVTLSGRF